MRRVRCADRLVRPGPHSGPYKTPSTSTRKSLWTVIKGSGRMSRPVPRPFSVADAMVLIAATCVAVAAARYSFRNYCQGSTSFAILPWCSAWFLMPFVVTYLFFCLRKPRPSRVRLFTQPGIQAVLAMGLCLPVIQFDSASRDIKGDGIVDQIFTIFTDLEGLTWGFSDRVGPTVAIVWIVTSLAGRRRSEAYWIDRMGRGLGWAWIVIWLVDRCYWIWLASYM